MCSNLKVALQVEAILMVGIFMLNTVDGTCEKDIEPWQQMMTMVMERVYLMSVLVRTLNCLLEFTYSFFLSKFWYWEFRIMAIQMLGTYSVTMIALTLLDINHKIIYLFLTGNRPQLFPPLVSELT